MRTKVSASIAVAVALGATWSIGWPAGAATLLEYNFLVGPTGTDQPASESVASATATIIDSNGNGSGVYPTVNTGTALGVGFKDDVMQGSIAYTGGFASFQGIVTKDTDLTAATNNDWVDYFGSGVGFGTGSAIVVFKPNPGAGTTQHPRHAFLSHNVGGAGQFWLFDSDDSDGPRLIIGGQDFNSGPITWSSTTWYLLAASWTTGGQARLFIQPLSPGGTLQTGASVGTVGLTSDAQMSFPIGFNYRTNAAFPESGQFTVALYRLTNEYLNAAGFADLYQSFLPEPATASLLMLGVVTLCRRR